MLCITKFQSVLLNKKFFLHIDCKYAKEVLQKKMFKIDFCSMASYIKYFFLF
jgi:hypothetical protein